MNLAQLARLRARRPTTPPPPTAKPVSNLIPVITYANLNAGTVATVNHGGWTGSPISFRTVWLRNNVIIPGENLSTYTFNATNDDAKMISAQVFATNAAGESVVPGYANAVGPIVGTSVPNAPIKTVDPVVSYPNLKVGSLATTSNGAFTNSPTGFKWRWFRDGSVIPNEIGPTYRFATADLGHNIRSGVIAANGTDSAEALSAAVGPIIAGTAPGTLSFDAAYVVCNTPQVLTVLGAVGAISSPAGPGHIPSGVSSVQESPDGFHINAGDNNVQWDALSNTEAGFQLIELIDAAGNILSDTIEKRMALLNNQCEVGAPTTGFVSWLVGVPLGSTASLTGGGGFFELKSYTVPVVVDQYGVTTSGAGGEKVWFVRRTALTTGFGVGTYVINIASPGLTPISAIITVIANQGAASTWPDPRPPDPPVGPFTTVTGTKTLASGTTTQKERITTAIVPYQITGPLNDAVVQDFDGDGSGSAIVKQIISGSSIIRCRFSRLRGVNCVWKGGKGPSVVATAATKCLDCDFEHFYFHSDDYALSEGDIYGGTRLGGKIVDVAIGGRWNIRYQYSDGMRMADFANNDPLRAIDYPNEDGVSVEMFYTQLGIGTIHDLYIVNCSDAGLDVKCLLGTVISRIKSDDCRQCVKDWVSNVFEHEKSYNSRVTDLMRMTIPSEPAFGGQKYNRFRRPHSVHRSIYSNNAAVPWLRCEIGPSCTAYQLMEGPAGKPFAACTSTARGSVIMQPNGKLLVSGVNKDNNGVPTTEFVEVVV